MFCIKNPKKIWIIIAGLLNISLTLTVQAQINNIISLEQINSDQSCGPRCIWALMQITKAGKPEYDVKQIYQLIGREYNTPTSLLDLKNTAQKLGFSAVGYKTTIGDLKKIDGYAILPVGITQGTKDNPFHFILVNKVTRDSTSIVNTKVLKTHTITNSELKKFWNGYALIISAGKNMKPLLKYNDDKTLLFENDDFLIKQTKYEKIKDFGIVDSGSILEHRFIINNPSPNPSNIKIVGKSCSCLTTNLTKDPQGQTTLEMKLHVDKPAHQTSDVILLFEPEGILKRYALQAYGKNSFQIHPSLGYMEAHRGETVEYPVRIFYFTDTKDIVTLEGVDGDIIKLKDNSINSNIIPNGKSKTCVFDFFILYSADEKPNKTKTTEEKVNFVLDTTRGKRKIPFKFLVVTGTGLFTLKPNKIFLLTSKSAPASEKKVKLEFLNEVFPVSVETKLDNNLPLETVIIEEQKGIYLIKLKIKDEMIKKLSLGIHKGNLSILPQGLPDIPDIVIPVSIFIRE